MGTTRLTGHRYAAKRLDFALEQAVVEPIHLLSNSQWILDGLGFNEPPLAINHFRHVHLGLVHALSYKMQVIM